MFVIGAECLVAEPKRSRDEVFMVLIVGQFHVGGRGILKHRGDVGQNRAERRRVVECVSSPEYQLPSAMRTVLYCWWGTQSDHARHFTGTGFPDSGPWLGNSCQRLGKPSATSRILSVAMRRPASTAIFLPHRRL